jgi:hypothetical protein
MNEEKNAARTEPTLADESTARLNETVDRVPAGDTPPAPAPALLMMSGDDAGLCTGDACAIPVRPRKVQ